MDRRASQFKQAFIKRGLRRGYLSEHAKILVAVSGGVDSMVLLDCLMTAQKQIGFRLGVVHIDHRLRSVSADEATYLADFCDKNNLTFHLKVWENPAEQGIETSLLELFGMRNLMRSYEIIIMIH